jgi:hypothetical protein
MDGKEVVRRAIERVCQLYALGVKVDYELGVAAIPPAAGTARLDPVAAATVGG